MITINKLDLDSVPVKTIIKILKTGDTSILGVENHVEVAESLVKEYRDVFPIDKTELNRQARFEALNIKKRIVLLCIEGLKFRKDDDLIDILKKYGYSFNHENYIAEIEKIEKQSQSIDIEIKSLKSQMPPKDESDIDEVIIRYCSIAGVNYDSNKITARQLKALQNIAEQKAKNGK